MCLPLVQLALMNFFIMCDNWKQYFYTNLSLPRVLVKPPCCSVLWNKCFERTSHFMSFISTIMLIQKFKIKLLLLKFSQKKYLLIAFFFHSHFANVLHFSLKMKILKLRGSLEACFLNKSCNQVFMTCICSRVLFN